MYKKFIPFLLILAIVFTLVFPNDVFAGSGAVYLNEDFSAYESGSSPQEVNVSTATYYIGGSDKDKVLVVSAGKKAAEVSFETYSPNEVCISFDVMYAKEMVEGDFSVVSLDGVAQKILSFSSSGHITSADGYRFGGIGSKQFTNVAIKYGQAGKMDVYVNGRCVKSGFRLPSESLADVAGIRFSFASENEGREIVLDNIYVGSSLRKSGAKKAVPLTTETPDFDSEFGKRVGSDVYLKGDFEKVVPGFAAHKSNVIEQYKEDDNTVGLFQRKNESDFHLDIKDLNSEYDSVVYEWKMKVRDPASQLIVYMADMNKAYSYLARLKPGCKLTLANEYEVKLKENEWVHIVAVYNYYDETRDIYFNGEKVISGKAYESPYMDNSEHQWLRFHVYNSTDGSENIDFMIDDIFVYDGEKPLESLSDFERVLDTESEKTVFYSEKAQLNLLEGKISFHKRSGVVYANGKKHELSTKPYEKDGLVYIDAAEMDAATGRKSNLSGSVTLHKYASSIGMTLSQDKVTDLNDGMYVLSSSSFSFPTDATSLDRLNNFAFYFRPDREEVEKRYKASPLSGVHPRVQANKEDFDRIREGVKTDPYIKNWADLIRKKADATLSTAPVKYELRDGVRLLYVSRDVTENMYTLGMAYQLTGDMRYVDRAYKDLYAVCGEFSDWHPAHHLDVGEMAAGVAIGYDWMYHAFTPEQRAVIENGMYQNGLYFLGKAYQSTKGSMGESATMPGNHNTVINSAALMAALAMYDVYPAESNYILSNAMRSHELYLWHFAPDGLWYEGPSYWELTTQYLTKAITTLDKFFGTDFSLSSMEGLSTTADFVLNTQSPVGVYAYSDCVPLDSLYSPEMFWMAERYGNDSITKTVYNSTGGKLTNGEDYALALLWCDTSAIDSTVSSSLPLDTYYENHSLLTSRNSWTDEKAYFGAHAGYSVEDHSQLDVGSFIFDLSGVRWSDDLGMGDYNAPRNAYWDSKENGLKWQLFMCRAESHSTLAVNPDMRADHIPLKTAYGKLRVVQSKPRGLIASVDMTPILRDVNSAKRGFFFTDNRQSLVIRDEVSLQKESDIYWFMITRADAEINGNRITLTKNGKKLHVDFITNGEAEVSFGPAVPLSTSPVFEGDKIPANCNRLIIKVHGSDSVNITVKLTGEEMGLSEVKDYDKAISEWSVPDGDIPVAPSITSVTVAGKEYDISSGSLEYSFIDGELTEVPEIIAYSDMYDIEIRKGSSLDENAKIVVKDKNDSSNKTIYNIMFKRMPKPVSFDGLETHPILSVKVSDEPQPANAASMAIDGNLETRWSADGAGHYIILDLGEEKDVDTVIMAFYVGDTRSTRLGINVSNDGEIYEKVWEGLSSGKTSDYEKFEIEPRKARYIKIDCNGNTSASVGGWNSINEIVVASTK